MRIKRAAEVKAAHDDDFFSHDRFDDDDWKKEDYPDDYDCMIDDEIYDF